MFFSCMTSPDTLCLFPVGPVLQQERYYGYYNEDYYEPFCDFHSETGYPLHAQDEKDQSQYKEYYREIDQISHSSVTITSFSILIQPCAPRF